MNRIAHLTMWWLPLLLFGNGVAAQQHSYSDQIVHKRYEFGNDFVEDDWLPYRKGTVEQTWDSPAMAGVTVEAQRTYTLAQRTAMQHNMREFHGVMMTSPLLAHLQGVGARVYGSLGVSRESYWNWPSFVNAPHLYLTGHLSINMNPYMLLDGKASFYHEYWRPLMLKANNMSMLLVGGSPIFSGYDYIEYTPPLYEWFGHPVYVEQHLMGYTLLKAIVTNKGIPLHRPVTYREFMTAALENIARFERDSMQTNQEKSFIQME